jgi:hypothetical protein
MLRFLQQLRQMITQIALMKGRNRVTPELVCHRQ